jgi:hypothetical protein
VRAATLLAAAALSAAIAGCGGSGGDTASTASTPATTPASLGYTQGRQGAERAATAAVATYDAAIRNGDGRTICGLTSRTKKALAACRDTLAATFHPRGKQPDFHVSSVRVSGRHAVVTLKAPGAKPVYYTLVRDGGVWKILVVTNQR